MIQFHGTMSGITWTVSPSESWQGLTVDAPDPTPERAVLVLIGMGLLGLALRRRHPTG